MKGDPLDEIVGRHNAVASVSGAVLFGVRGQSPRQNRIASLIDQVHRNVPTFLYLVQIQSPAIKAFRAPLLWAGNSVAPDERSLIPPYYATLLPEKPVVLWLKVGEFREMPWKRMDSFSMEYTGTPLAHVLLKSMGSVLIVAQGVHPPRSAAREGLHN
jgi:hypothetical protein